VVSEIRRNPVSIGLKPGSVCVNGPAIVPNHTVVIDCTAANPIGAGRHGRHNREEDDDDGNQEWNKQKSHAMEVVPEHMRRVALTGRLKRRLQ
jgi:hypothetical protein